MMVTRKIVSSILLAWVLMLSLGITCGKYLLPEAVYAATNITAFNWAYTGKSVDGKDNGRFHKLGKGTAQLMVSGCAGYTEANKATVVLRKKASKYPYYKNCGTVKFYKKGMYTFGEVNKDSYWLHVSGGRAPGIKKSAGGKVQNK